MDFLFITGFGHHLAKRLENHGYTVYAGVLDPEGEGARSLSDVGLYKMFVLPMDVTSDIQVKGAAEQVRSLADDKGKKDHVQLNKYGHWRMIRVRKTMCS